MNGGTWDGEAAASGNVEYEVSYATSPTRTSRITFWVEKYYSGLHVAHALAREWNSERARPRAEVETIHRDSSLPPAGRVWIAATQEVGPVVIDKPDGLTFTKPAQSSEASGVLHVPGAPQPTTVNID